MKRWLVLILFAFGMAFAGGRFGLSLGYVSSVARVRGYVEYITFSLAGVEATAGFRFGNDWGLGPMITTALFTENFNIRFELDYEINRGVEFWTTTNISW